MNNASQFMKTDENANDSSFLALQDLQYNGVDYLYNLEPQQNNLFMIDKFYDPVEMGNNSSGNGGAQTSYEINGDKPSNIEYRIKKVSGFKLPSLDVKSDMSSGPFRWNYVATGRTDQNTLTISWVEDVFWTVKRYHMNWMNHWYNKYLDVNVCGLKGKFRNLVLYSYHYVNVNTQTATPVQKAMPIARFQFNGLVPKSMNEGSFDWASPGNEEFTDVQYTYNSLEVYFYPYTPEDREYIGGMAQFVQSEKADATGLYWNTGILGFTKTLDGMDLEGQFKDCKDGLHPSVYYI